MENRLLTPKMAHGRGAVAFEFFKNEAPASSCLQCLAIALHASVGFREARDHSLDPLSAAAAIYYYR